MAAAATIPTRSRRQAMDWGLVLASQDIPATIIHEPESDGWGLRVEQPDLQRAVAVLRLYHLENRGRFWRQELPWPGVTFHWGAAIWVLAILAAHALGAYVLTGLRSFGAMDNAAVVSGEWWRLLTATMLHADVGHLALNATTGFVLMGLACGRLGLGVGLLAATLAGVGGNLAGALVYSDAHRGLGASGAIIGALGLLAADSAVRWRRDPPGARRVVAALVAGAMLFVLLGADPDSDLLAHLGGFVAGGLIGGALAGVPVRALNSRACVVVSWGILLVATAVAWWCALGE
jgi:membrane associated rhomboid family serine protease